MVYCQIIFITFLCVYIGVSSFDVEDLGEGFGMLCKRVPQLQRLNVLVYIHSIKIAATTWYIFENPPKHSKKPVSLLHWSDCPHQSFQMLDNVLLSVSDGGTLSSILPDKVVAIKKCVNVSLILNKKQLLTKTNIYIIIYHIET